MSLKSKALSFGSRVPTTKQIGKLDDSFQESSIRNDKIAPRAPQNEKHGSFDRGEKKALSSLSYNYNMPNYRKDSLKGGCEDSEEENDCNENNRSLKEELQEAKSRLKVVSGKVGTLRKERDNLQKENKVLQEEILTLQSSLRQMIPGFSNTGSSFPMMNELISNVSSFYKYECEDLFFDLLCPELNMKGIILFFFTSFHRLNDIVQEYFLPSENTLKKTACLANLEGPIMNVLRKSFQSTWKKILKQCFTSSSLLAVANEIQKHLNLRKDSNETTEQIVNFLQKLSELILCFYISDPPLSVNYKAIGSKVIYNPTKHEPLDGFIKSKEECIIILPSVHKNTIDGELTSKALVLQVDYEIPNCNKGVGCVNSLSKLYRRYKNIYLEFEYTQSKIMCIVQATISSSFINLCTDFICLMKKHTFILCYKSKSCPKFLRNL